MKDIKHPESLNVSLLQLWTPAMER